MCRRRAAHWTEFSNHRCPIIDAQSIGKIWRCNVPPPGGTLHRLFQPSMPDHRCPIHRTNMEEQCAAAGRHIAQTFPIIDAQSSMPNHRCPIIEPQSIEKKTMDVQFATGGAANCTDFSNHRCPIIDAQSIGKIWRCNLQTEGCKLHRLFPSSMPDFAGTPIEYQRTPIK